MMQKLSNRLAAAADFVTWGYRAADIGTDHGFLPIWLIQSGRCPLVTAMDIREGPLMRAKEHIAAAGLEGRIQTRLSDGLKQLASGEADSVVIAGMGGLTVIKILQDAAGQLQDIKELVLEPQSDPAKVRRFLREHDMCVDREELVFEDGKYYPILHVVTESAAAGTDPWQQVHKIFGERLPDEKRQRRLTDQYGACLILNRHPLLQGLLERDEKRALLILHALKAGSAKAECSRRREEVEKQLEEIRILRSVIEE